MSEKKIKIGIRQYRLKIGDEKKVLKFGRPTQIKLLRSVERVKVGNTIEIQGVLNAPNFALIYEIGKL